MNIQMFIITNNKFEKQYEDILFNKMKIKDIETLEIIFLEILLVS